MTPADSQMMFAYLQNRFPDASEEVLNICVTLYGDKWMAQAGNAIKAERQRVLGIMKLADGRPAYYKTLQQFALDGKTTPGEAATAILQGMA